MVVPSGSVQLGYSDKEVNALLKRASGANLGVSRHYSQNEEFFVRLPRPIRVPSFPVHHDIANKTPGSEQRRCVRAVIEQLLEIVPEFLVGLTHLFDPSSNYRPVFFRLYEVGAIRFLYLARIDLTFRATRGRQIERASNQLTPEYETSHLFIESDLFPLSALQTRGDKISGMTLEQAIRDTWIGETGRGYMRAGMWLDRDLTKFFSRVLTPVGVQSYPYYPFTCKYRAVGHATLALNESERRRSVQIANRARAFLLPHVPEIEESLRSVPTNEFSEDLPEFRRLKRAAGTLLDSAWKDFSVRRYLNENDEREFEVVHGLT